MELLPVPIISLPYLKEALILEMTGNNKKVIVSVIYCSPGQNNSEFGLFLSYFDKRLSDISKHKPSLSVITLMQDLPLSGLKASVLQSDRNCFHELPQMCFVN